MATLTIQVEDAILDRLRSRAEANGQTVEEWAADVVKRAGCSPADDDPFFGLFADEPELMDEVVRLAMEDRERERSR